MKMRKWSGRAVALAALLGMSITIGCKYIGPMPEATSNESTEAESDDSETEPNENASSDEASEGATVQEKSPPSRDTVREEAKVGMGKKGHYGGEGVVVTPVEVYWRTGERIKLLQIQDQLKKYKALHGEAPQSHEEFMEEIVKPLRIELPPLPPGERYIYVPEKETLMVEKPK